MTGVVVDHVFPLISQAIYSGDLAKVTTLNWLPNNFSAISDTDIATYSDDDTNKLVSAINSLGFSSSFALTLIAFWSTVLYRYTYQSEFEIQYAQESYGAPANDAHSLKFLNVNYHKQSKLTAEQFSHSISEILSATESNSQVTKPPVQSAFCLVELNQQDDETYSNIRGTCAFYKGKIWPLIENIKGGYKLRWLYDRRISLDIVKALQAHILTLVNQSRKRPNIPISQQLMLTKEEVQQQLDFSKGKQHDYKSLPLYQSIENHALIRPDQTAVTYEQSELTYAQLNSQANRLAHGLLDREAVHGSAIAVYIAPSTDILVSILAIHKAGCVYVPVDPGFPTARVSAILKEVNPLIILCDGNTDKIPLNYSPICHTIDNIQLSTNSDSNPDITVAPDDLSHIYFTSGTTGKPKGVLATHNNLTHYISSAINRYKFNQNDVFLAGARFTFSISMFELMTPLVAGGCVKILPRELILDLGQLSHAIKSATVFHFGPSLLKKLLPYIEENYHSFEPFDQLTHASSGGDMVPPDILEKLKKIFRNAEVFVIYGSSEISCMGCTYEIPRDKTISRTLVGRPHQNVKIKILDHDGNIVPVGVPGQIYFGGNGLVKGYLNLPELTQEKFTRINGERFYAIGDIGRFDQAGNIELLGREDFQVQIRGMRIELLEVEACLKSYPPISDCVVIASSLQNNDEKSLIAYLVFHTDKKVAADDIHRFIADLLPDYMVPAVLVKLDTLPTNYNAKLDRSQLPHPGTENIITTADFQMASNHVEEALISIWKSLFNISNIGVDHNFFELGGDSLLAVSFLVEVDRKFDKFIPISFMMDVPTIRGIAKIITSDKPIEGIGDVVVLKKGNYDPPLFCLDAVFVYKDLAMSLDIKRMVCGVHIANENSMILKDTNSEDYQVFSSVDNIANRYSKSIRAFQQHGPYYLCGHSFGGVIALEVARMLRNEGETVQLVAIFDAFAPGYQESLSRIKRIMYHLQIMKQAGWPYLKEKIVGLMMRKVLSANIGNSLVKGIENFRNKLRDHAFSKYLPEPYQGEVLLFKAKKRKDFEVGMKDLGWGKFIDKLVTHDINGDHYEIIKRGHVEELAKILRKEIE